MEQRRELGERTKKEYLSVLRLAYGGDDSPASIARGPSKIVEGWTEGRRVLLRAAVKWHLKEHHRAAPDVITSAINTIPSIVSGKKRIPRIPSEKEAEAYRAAAEKLPPGLFALAMLPLQIGLRADEVLSMPRDAVERAARFGELTFIRKGDKEQTLPVEKLTALFQALLDMPAAPGTTPLNGPPPPTRKWRTLREILTPGKPGTAYVIFHDLIRDLGKVAGIPRLRPHLLRHAFATRMNRDGAPLPLIQWWLNHAHIATTMRYVHPTGEDAKKFVRGW
jgi:site-specific recombinase XerD